MSKRTFTFVSAVNNRSVLEANLLASPCLRQPCAHEMLIQEGFASASKAYNDAIDKAQGEFLIFTHQDMIFPEQWLAELDQALGYLEDQDPNWGVLGCYGETQNDGGRGYLFQPAWGVMGAPFDRPAPVRTLDEIVLVLRKSSGLRFDDHLPHFHLYGTDLCLRAESMGMTNYAVSAFCIHNTGQGFVLPKEFYECYKYVKRAWKSRLPITAPCVRITKFDFAMYERRLREIYSRCIRRKDSGDMRTHDVPGLIRQVDAILRQESASNSRVWTSGNPA